MPPWIFLQYLLLGEQGQPDKTGVCTVSGMVELTPGLLAEIYFFGFLN